MFEKITFFCVLLLSFVAISRARFPDDRGPFLRSTFPSVNAEKLIRELNLFPEKDVNIVRYGDASLRDGRKRIVEKRFRFPNVVEEEYGGVSVEDLGHHAGYYKIANSHAARSAFYFLLFTFCVGEFGKDSIFFLACVLGNYLIMF